MNGEMNLAEAAGALAKETYQTDLTSGENLFSGALNYMSILTACSKTLDEAQEKCSVYTQNATVGNTPKAREAADMAAKWHTEYQIDSTNMNKEMGSQNTLLNEEELMQHTESHAQVPVYLRDGVRITYFLNSFGSHSPRKGIDLWLNRCYRALTTHLYRI